ncbi:hypothetical protein [Myxococcus sp. RHSTA-1-4]|uniref:hypothetical protein n=1 Tax=Myxococcus sp. RHSTA-1-4 TaxID=2874601 RepID=UPI001CBEF650|nr:hypothetical protein [Myxococcus sp. RHSTA-1-4]MBZ4422671.1 hypothetical protein [Myxococcus sp. RHSTA-1-4]
MRVRLSRLLPLCVALGGCAMEPDDPIYLSGTALEADGTPWRGGPLSLMRPRKVNIRVNEYGGEVWDTRYEPWAEVTPGEDGLFLHRLNARDTGADRLDRPHPWASLNLFQLHLPPREEGARDFLEFELIRDADVPPLRAWDSHVRAQEEAGGVRLSWNPVVPTADIPEPEYFVRLRGETGLAWRVVASSGEPWLRPEMLEDFTDGFAHVQSFSRGARVWFTSTLYYSAVSEAPPLPLPFAGPVPASRGAACAVVETRPITPCPFTDGRLEPVQVPFSGSSLAQDLFILLREPVRPRRVLLRGLDTSSHAGEVLHVEGSVDGKTWIPLGDSAPFSQAPQNLHVADPDTERAVERFLDVPLAPDAPPVSRIRLWLTAPWTEYPGGPRGRGYFSSLREVSVFGAPAID